MKSVTKFKWDCDASKKDRVGYHKKTAPIIVEEALNNAAKNGTSWFTLNKYTQEALNVFKIGVNRYFFKNNYFSVQYDRSSEYLLRE